MTTATIDPVNDDADARTTARRMWARLEIVHTLVYFAPSVLAAKAEVGLKGQMMGYAASRIAPMGAVGPEVAVATFYNFSPRLLHRALPDAWSFASPDAVLDATQTAVADLLRDLWAGQSEQVAEAAELAREVALLHPIVGRPLAAAWSSVAWSDRPELVLWQAATRIRESRGDGHLALLVGHGVDGVETHLTLKGDSPKLRQLLSPLRGWSDDEWDAAADRLRDRGLLDVDGALTEAGTTLRADLEHATDVLAAPPWTEFGPDATERLEVALQPLVARVLDAGVLPGVIARRADL